MISAYTSGLIIICRSRTPTQGRSPNRAWRSRCSRSDSRRLRGRGPRPPPPDTASSPLCTAELASRSRSPTPPSTRRSHRLLDGVGLPFVFHADLASSEPRLAIHTPRNDTLPPQRFYGSIRVPKTFRHDFHIALPLLRMGRTLLFTLASSYLVPCFFQDRPRTFIPIVIAASILIVSCPSGLGYLSSAYLY